MPYQPELAMGAVVDGDAPVVVRNPEVLRLAKVPDAEFEAPYRRELAEIERRRRRYLGGRPSAELPGRTAIVVDDGIATGATVRAALQAVRRRGATTIVLAVPVAPTEALVELQRKADAVVCLEDHDPFGAIGMYYADFR